MKKFLIGMLASGENEKDEAIRSIRSQSIQSFDLEIIEGLPNKDAHDCLYELFNNRRGEYEYFLKHDADMVFVQDSALAKMYNILKTRPEVDMMMMDVMDWASGQLIPGQNCYSNRVVWEGNDDDLIVDYHGTYSGKQLRLREHPVPFVMHSPNPSRQQAFSYGVHKALKVLQVDRRKAFPRAALHFLILNNIWQQWCLHGDDRRLLCLAGTEAAYKHRDRFAKEGYKGAAANEIYEQEVVSVSMPVLAERISARWGAAVKNQERWLFS